MSQPRMTTNVIPARVGLVFAVKWPNDEEFYYAVCTHVNRQEKWARFCFVEDHTSIDYRFHEFPANVAFLETAENVEVLHKSKFYLLEQENGELAFVVCDKPHHLGFTILPGYIAIALNMRQARSRLFEIEYHWEGEEENDVNPADEKAREDRQIVDLTAEEAAREAAPPGFLVSADPEESSASEESQQIELIPNAAGWPVPDA